MGIDRPAERLARVMESRLRGPNRDLEGVGDLGKREAEEVVMDDDGAMVRRQFAQPSVECVPVGKRTGRIRRRAVVVGQETDVRFVPPPAAGLIVAGVHEKATEPCVEPPGIAQGRQIAPRAHERFLHRVLRSPAVTQDERCGRVQVVEAPGGQGRERFAIASGRGTDQCFVRHEALPCGARYDACTWYGASAAESVHFDRSGSIDGTQEQPMGADARIRPGTLDDNHACAAVLVEAINDLAVMAHAERRRHELGAAETAFEVALHNRAAVDHLLARGYRMDPFLTLVCSSAPFGRFDRYLFCSPALTL